MTKESRAYLEALAVALEPHGFATEMTDRGLKVTAPEPDCEPHLSGCCTGEHPVVLVLCRKRPHCGHWFFTSYKQSLGPAERIPETVVIVRGLLARPRVLVSCSTTPLVSGV